MSLDFERVSRVWRDQSEASIEQLPDEIQSRAGPAYAAIPRDQLLASVRQAVAAWQVALDTGDGTPIYEYSRSIGQRRAEAHVDMDEIMRVVDILREIVWQALGRTYAAGDWDMDVVAEVERWLHERRNGVVRSYGMTLDQAEQGLAEREQAIEYQRRLIQELSVPIVPIHEGMLVLPLVGAIDSRRASQVMEAALEKIVEFQADVLILDITGVPLVDTGVANYLLQMARAVKLLGAQVVLVGIGAEIAQTMVQLGVELRDVTTRSNLQAGIAFALAQQGFAISPLIEETAAALA
jgi:rsbT co-antagonist protein RsbR